MGASRRAGEPPPRKPKSIAGTRIMTSDNPKSGDFIGLTANIVSAYVSNNPVSAADIPGLINQVHAALVRVSGSHGDTPSDTLKPAVPVKKSITAEYIVCLE